MGSTWIDIPRQVQDPDTGLYYLRARYYDPRTAQFINVDPLASLTRSIYSYGGSNPLNNTDPSGLASIGWCLSGSAGFIMGAFGEGCLVVAIDDRDGNVTVGTTETFGGGMQTPALTYDVVGQISSARSVDQMGGVFGYGGMSLADVLDAGVTVFGGQNCDAPGGMVLGADLNFGVGVSPLAEVHMGASNTATQTWLSFNPFRVFK